MTTQIITIEDFKAVKEMFDKATRELEKGADLSGYVVVYSEVAQQRFDIIDKKAEKNVKIMSKVLGLPYNTIIDMVWDWDFAKRVLTDLKK